MFDWLEDFASDFLRRREYDCIMECYRNTMASIYQGFFQVAGGRCEICNGTGYMPKGWDN